MENIAGHKRRANHTNNNRRPRKRRKVDPMHDLVEIQEQLPKHYAHLKADMVVNWADAISAIIKKKKKKKLYTIYAKTVTVVCLDPPPTNNSVESYLQHIVQSIGQRIHGVNEIRLKKFTHKIKQCLLVIDNLAEGFQLSPYIKENGCESILSAIPFEKTKMINYQTLYEAAKKWRGEKKTIKPMNKNYGVAISKLDQDRLNKIKPTQQSPQKAIPKPSPQGVKAPKSSKKSEPSETLKTIKLIKDGEFFVADCDPYSYSQPTNINLRQISDVDKCEHLSFNEKVTVWQKARIGLQSKIIAMERDKKKRRWTCFQDAIFNRKTEFVFNSFYAQYRQLKREGSTAFAASISMIDDHLYRIEESQHMEETQHPIILTKSLFATYMMLNDVESARKMWNQTKRSSEWKTSRGIFIMIHHHHRFIGVAAKCHIGEDIGSRLTRSGRNIRMDLYLIDPKCKDKAEYDELYENDNSITNLTRNVST